MHTVYYYTSCFLLMLITYKASSQQSYFPNQISIEILPSQDLSRKQTQLQADLDVSIIRVFNQYAEDCGYHIVPKNGCFVAQASINYGDWKVQKLPEGFFDGKYSVALLIYDRASKDTVAGRVISLEELGSYQTQDELYASVQQKFGVELLLNSGIIPLHKQIIPDNDSGNRPITIGILPSSLDSEITNKGLNAMLDHSISNMFAHFTWDRVYDSQSIIYPYKVFRLYENEDVTELDMDILVKSHLTEKFGMYQLNLTIQPNSPKAIMDYQVEEATYDFLLDKDRLNQGDFSEFLRKVIQAVYVGSISKLKF